jgi:hypothetical protein
MQYVQTIKFDKMKTARMRRLTKMTKLEPRKRIVEKESNQSSVAADEPNKYKMSNKLTKLFAGRN